MKTFTVITSNYFLSCYRFLYCHVCNNYYSHVKVYREHQELLEKLNDWQIYSDICSKSNIHDCLSVWWVLTQTAGTVHHLVNAFFKPNKSFELTEVFSALNRLPLWALLQLFECISQLPEELWGPSHVRLASGLFCLRLPAGGRSVWLPSQNGGFLNSNH